MALAQAGKVTLHTKTYPLTAAPDALADLDAGRVRGRAILVLALVQKNLRSSDGKGTALRRRGARPAARRAWTSSPRR